MIEKPDVEGPVAVRGADEQYIDVSAIIYLAESLQRTFTGLHRNQVRPQRLGIHLPPGAGAVCNRKDYQQIDNQEPCTEFKRFK